MDTMTRMHRSLTHTLAVLVSPLLFTCSKPAPSRSATPTPVAAETPRPTPAMTPIAEPPSVPMPPGVVGAGRSYRRVFSGPVESDGKVHAVVAGRDMTDEGHGILDLLD